MFETYANERNLQGRARSTCFTVSLLPSFVIVAIASDAVSTTLFVCPTSARCCRAFFCCGTQSGHIRTKAACLAALQRCNLPCGFAGIRNSRKRKVQDSPDDQLSSILKRRKTLTTARKNVSNLVEHTLNHHYWFRNLHLTTENSWVLCRYRFIREGQCRIRNFKTFPRCSEF